MSKDTTPLIEIKRYTDNTGTYAVTLVEQKRERITTKDDFVDLIANIAEEASQAYEFEKTLTIIGRKNPYMIFAQEFVKKLKADTKVSDLVKKYLEADDD